MKGKSREKWSLQYVERDKSQFLTKVKNKLLFIPNTFKKFIFIKKNRLIKIANKKMRKINDIKGK